MQTDAFGRLLDIDAPESVTCSACDGSAERLSSAFQGGGVAYHHYRCRDDDCPAAGSIVEHDSGDRQRVGPVFGDRDLAVRFATRDHPEVPADLTEVAP
jgi:hypothetical protein